MTPESQRSLLAPSLLACLLIFCVGVAVAVAAGAANGDADDETILEERHHIQLKLDDDMELIEIDDLQPGESRQFFTDEGKEIVITRSDDGIEITVDGEELDVPKIVRVKALHEGTLDGEGRKVIVRTQHADEHGAVWISSGQEGESVVEIERLGEGGHRMHWVSGDGAKIELHRRSAAEHLETSGALHGLDASEREAILEALGEFDAETPHRKMIFIETDKDENEG